MSEPTQEASTEEVLRIAAEAAVRWTKTLELLAQGPEEDA